MINKLKFKFVLLTMISLLVLLTVLIGVINVMSYTSVVKDADKVIEVISHNKGTFPEHKNEKEHKNRKPLSPEAPYESRFFTVIFDNYGNVIQTNTSKVKSVDDEKAKEYGTKVYDKYKENGFIDVYRYAKSEENNGIRITFLDCRKQLDSFHSFLYWSILMSVVGYLIVFVIIFICSGRIIKPISESYEKQKQFITDAGHEIKTPLTIISANTDILEAQFGNNECISDIQHQTKRLSELTNDLVYLAKMDESSHIDLIDVPYSDIITDNCDKFRILAKAKNLSFTCAIEPLITVNGNIKALEHLIGILLDNALKYASKEGNITINLSKHGKHAELSISNTVAEHINDENIGRIFERFYRIDSSRNSETGGHGIGLSIAKAIVDKHNGKIYSDSSKENIFTINVILPT